MSDSNDPGYIYDPLNYSYSVTAAAGTDVTLTASNTIVFGGLANLTYEGGGSTVVLPATRFKVMTPREGGNGRQRGAQTGF